MDTDASSPLHKVIDARQWDALCFLGRLMAVVHAAFIDAGFVLVSASSEKLHSPWLLPRSAAAPTPIPSLRYTVTELVHQRPTAHGAFASAAVARLLVLGDLVFLSSYLESSVERWPRQHGRSMDARAIAPLLLTGGLDDAARALESDAAGIKPPPRPHQTS
ncbi:hypothetical protein HU200_016711 [Digitaria exilis]|uniref:Uncharacterized protein n=1 Tax=Digitaria exilis TaxID=1010633 RepID=A0A835F8D1_9POAL|nr:hypothetical protein HU200_016711 [Digitaria exilis]